MLPETFLQWATQWHQALSPLREVNPHAARCVEHLTSYLEADDRHSAMNSCVEALTQEDARRPMATRKQASLSIGYSRFS